MNQRLTSLLIHAGITAAVALSCFGCSSPAGDRHREVAYGIDQPVRTVVIEGRVGDVQVTGTGTAVRVTERQSYRSTAPQADHRVAADGTLTLGYRCPDGDCGIGYRVEVPAGTAVRIRNGSGAVRLDGLTAAVSAETGTGSITAVHLGAGGATLHTGTGDVTAEFAAAPGSVAADSSTGDVRVTVPAGDAYQVRAAADTGTAKVTVPQSPGAARAIEATSSTGDVTVAHA
ncbi:DUF4097 family beta strand repeat-containing protein [Kitasatospora sp. NPDC058965]|uniref:DUF4097 family beta strand repeat-containing protein n=1 Tax=Kitasatospora sp. NPDC058965 TaxID=3346682 RepID=UPI0036AA0EDF